jgi:O-antigen/teichoic acid export membrane protein
MIRKFLKGSQYYIYTAYLPTLISLFTLPIITPYLSLRDYGLYGILFSVYNFVSLVFNLGFFVEYQNTFFNNPDDYKDKWASILGFQLSWNLITFIPFSIILAVFVKSEVSSTELLISVLSLLIPYMILDPIKTMGSRHLQYTDKHKQLFVITITGIIVQYTLVVLLITLFKLGFIAWLIGNLANSLILALFFFIYLKKNHIGIKLNISRAGIAHRFKTQMAIVLHNVSGYALEASDRILLALFKVPIAQIGAYNIAYNYTNYGQTVNTAMNTVFSPMYFKSIRNLDSNYGYNEISRLFKFWVNLTFFMIVNMILWAEYLFQFLYRNQTLSNTFVYAFPMIISLIYRPFYVMVVDNLIVQEKTRYVSIISLSSALLNIILNIIFIPYFGIMATVYTTAIAYTSLGFLGLFVGKIRKELTNVYYKAYPLVFVLLIVSLALIHFLNLDSFYLRLLICLIFGTLLVLLNFKSLKRFISEQITI